MKQTERKIIICTIFLILTLLSGCRYQEVDNANIKSINEFKPIDIETLTNQELECLYVEEDICIFSVGNIDKKYKNQIYVDYLIKINTDDGLDPQIVSFSKPKYITDAVLYKQGIIYVSLIEVDEIFEWEIVYNNGQKNVKLLSGFTVALERAPCLLKTSEKIFILCENNNGKEPIVTQLLYLNDKVSIEKIVIPDFEETILSTISFKESEGYFVLYLPGEQGKFVIGNEFGVTTEVPFVIEPIDYEFVKGNLFVEYEESGIYRYSIIDEKGKLIDKQLENAIYNICVSSNEDFVLGTNYESKLILLEPNTGIVSTVARIGDLKDYRVSVIKKNKQNDYLLALVSSGKTYFGYIYYTSTQCD